MQRDSAESVQLHPSLFYRPAANGRNHLGSFGILCLRICLQIRTASMDERGEGPRVGAGAPAERLKVLNSLSFQLSHSVVTLSLCVSSANNAMRDSLSTLSVNGLTLGFLSVPLHATMYTAEQLMTQE